MRLFAITLLAVCVLMLAVGCSKEKKEEAAKLEMELLEQEAGDTMAGTTGVVDTATTTTGQQPDAQAVPQEPKPVEPLPEVPVGDGYTVQVAATTDMDYARELIDLYKQRGYDPFMATAQVGGETYYRIRIGSFENRADAKLLQAELLDRFSISAWVDELTS